MKFVRAPLRGPACNQAVDGLFISAEGAVVLDVKEVAAKGELVLALAPGQVFADLDEVLRSAEGNGVAGRGAESSRGS